MGVGIRMHDLESIFMLLGHPPLGRWKSGMLCCVFYFVGFGSWGSAFRDRFLAFGFVFSPFVVRLPQSLHFVQPVLDLPPLGLHRDFLVTSFL